MRRWFEFRARARDVAEIVIYDEIGAFGIAAKAFLDELKALGPVAELTLRINSPGGSVFDGVAIYNALKRHQAKVTVWIDGIAASIASMVAMAGAPGPDTQMGGRANVLLPGKLTRGSEHVEARRPRASARLCDRPTLYRSGEVAFAVGRLRERRRMEQKWPRTRRAVRKRCSFSRSG